RVERLADQCREPVGAAAGKVVIVHGVSFLAGPCISRARTVDPRARPVNKAPRVGYRESGGFSVTSVPESMAAIAIREPGGPEMLVPETRAVPRPGPGELLIRVAAAGVNRPDVLQRMGFY